MAGQGQAEVSNPGQIQKGTERQAQGKGRQKSVIQGSIRKVQNGMPAQGQGRQNGQNWED